MDRSAFFWQIQDGKLPPPRAAVTLGISIREVSPEAGTIEVEFEGKPEFTNPAGHIQGGFLAAMLDDTMGPALAATLGAGHPEVKAAVMAADVLAGQDKDCAAWIRANRDPTDASTERGRRRRRRSA